MEYLNFTKIDEDVSIRINRHFTGINEFSTYYRYFLRYSYGPNQDDTWAWTSVYWDENSETSSIIKLTNDNPKVYFIGRIRMMFPIQFVIDGGNVLCDGDVMSIVSYSSNGLLTKVTEDRFGYTYTTNEDGELIYRDIIPFCLYGLFEDCTNLITPPKIGCTNVSAGGCARMFKGCSNLISAPELNAYVIGEGAYYEMFYNCSKISSIACNVFQYENNSLKDWVYGINNNGTFYKNKISSFNSGVNGIPSNWTSEIYEKWDVEPFSSEELDYYRDDIDYLRFDLLRKASSSLTLNENFEEEFDNFIYSAFSGSYAYTYHHWLSGFREFFLPGMKKYEVSTDIYDVPLNKNKSRLHFIPPLISYGMYEHYFIHEYGAYGLNIRFPNRDNFIEMPGGGSHPE